jgi:hypothetical protein
MLTNYTLNSRVTVRIDRLIPPGLLGQVVDGPQAIIRRREVAWDESLPRSVYLGQTRKAVVIG